jgi:hypothetical protein
MMSFIGHCGTAAAREGGRPRMFDVTTSRDFLAKVEADFDDFMKEPYRPVSR